MVAAIQVIFDVHKAAIQVVNVVHDSSHIVVVLTTAIQAVLDIKKRQEGGHYRTRLLCRVPETLGKGRKTLGKEVAECSTRRSAHGLSSTGPCPQRPCLAVSTALPLHCLPKNPSP